ncbi:MAG: hypothetical protein HYX74_11440, partial [Acidobacteria bacterium]|nr:hypothetical protein [Acidobacteriota bacterium]
MTRKNWIDLMRQQRVLGFVMLLLALAIGIGIGTVVQRGASAEKALPDVAQLKISGEGHAVGLDSPVSLQEGFGKVAEAVEPAVVNVRTSQIIKARARSRTPQPQGEQPFD